MSTMSVRFHQPTMAILTAAALAGPAAAQVPTDTARAVADVRAATAARFRGDSAAWQLLAPGFIFGHSTSHPVDDRAATIAFFAQGRAAMAAAHRPQSQPLPDAEPPVVRLDGDVLVISSLQGDSARPGGRPLQSRSLDVYVWRGGAWQWLAHQTAVTSPHWAPAVVEASTLDEYAGQYRCGGMCERQTMTDRLASNGTSRTYARRGTGLVLVTPNGERPLIALSDATFGYPGRIATVTFVRDRNGRVIAADESAQIGFQRYLR